MSERLLDAFREEAERVTPVPAFGLIEQRGRARRRRRHAAVALVAACTLGVAGFVSATDARSGDPQPADDRDPSSLATPWPGPTMTTLPKGTYDIPVAVGSHSVAARFTLPPGWNAWLGPNRFEGLGRRVTHDARTNERILSRDPDWYVGLLVLDVDWIAQRGCTAADMRESDVAGLVRALQDAPGLDILDGPSPIVGPDPGGVHLTLRDRGTVPACSRDLLFQSTHGPIGYGEAGSVVDVRVLDVDGRAVLVWAEWTRHTPAAEVEALLGIVDSAEVHDGE